MRSPPTTRVVHTIWDHLGLEFLEKVFSGNPRYSNPVGALPSVHARVPAAVPAAVLGVRPARGGGSRSCCYTLVMAFALVYLAEHYVTDIAHGLDLRASLAFVVVEPHRSTARSVDATGAAPTAQPLGPSA